MNVLRLPLLAITSLAALALGASSSHATTFNGNGNTGFGGDLGLGSMSVTNDGTGGLKFVLTLNGTSNVDPSNAVVLYIDDGAGGGIGTDTSGMTDTSNGATEAIAEFGGGTNRSTLNFGGFLNPQYGVSLTNNNALDYKLADGTNFTFTDNADTGAGASTNGESFSISGDVWTLDLPAIDFGLSSFSGSSVRFVAMEVSQTGYSSNEATVAVSPSNGTEGYGTTLTLGSANTFTLATVPEGSTVGLLACGLGLLLIRSRTRYRRL